MSEFTVRRADWNQDRAAICAIREMVFMCEQGVTPELEWDGEDEAAHHLLAIDKNGAAIGTARLLANGHIGRMSVVKVWRGCGVGSAPLEAALELANELHLTRLQLDAQSHATGFYQRFGFVAEGSEFLDAEIPHYHMVRSA